jgi:hypothetical protein
MRLRHPSRCCRIDRPLTKELFVRLAICAVAVLALAACSPSHVDNPTLKVPPSVSITGTATGATGALPDPCTLADSVEVRTIFGGVSSPGERPTGATRQECDWTITGSNLGFDGRVILYYPSVQSSAAFNAAKAGTPGVQPVLPGTGDDAFYVPTTGALTVLVGEHQFVLQGLFGNDAPSSITRETALSGMAGVTANRLNSK